MTSGTVNDENNYIEVSRRGQYQVSGLSASNEYLFKGSENPLQVRTVFSHVIFASRTFWYSDEEELHC